MLHLLFRFSSDFFSLLSPVVAVAAGHFVAHAGQPDRAQGIGRSRTGPKLAVIRIVVLLQIVF